MHAGEEPATTSSASSLHISTSLSPHSTVPAGKPITRTPSAVNFPGAFNSQPVEAQQLNESFERIAIVPRVMKSRVTEAVGGVVDSVYNIVSYVNPLAAKTEQSEEAAESKPGTPASIMGVSSGSTSVAADIDERLVADANADNPENQRPPTPTKSMFSSILRMPAAPVTDPSKHASNAEYKQAVRNDPVSMNVSQRTGHQFRPRAEEKRRYMRRMSKAPQLNLPVWNQRAGVSEETAPEPRGSSDESDDSDDDGEPGLDAEEIGAATMAEHYAHAAENQRLDLKTRAVEPWRFIIPRVKRVKRRALWRLFLAQEIAPVVYDEAGHAVRPHTARPASRSKVSSGPSSPAMSPQRSRNPSTAHAGTAAADQLALDSGNLRRRMLESAAAKRGSMAGSDFDGARSLRTKPSHASHVSQLAEPGAEPTSAKKSQSTGIWTMEFSACGRYLAAGGQDGVLRIWRIAAFAREQARDKQHKDAEQPVPRSRAAHRDGHKDDLGTAQTPSPISAHKRSSTVYIDGKDILPYANSAPISKGGKHSRSVSAGQPLLSPRTLAYVPDATTLSQFPLAPIDDAVPMTPGDAHSSPTPSRANSLMVDAQSVAAAALASQAQLHPMHAYELLEPVPFRSYVGHSADILSLSWSKNGFLLSASMDRTVRLWHPHRPECLCTFRHRDIVTSVAFNPRDDRTFISGSLDCKLRLWDIPARSVRHWTKLPDGQMVTSVAFTSPRGEHIVAGTYKGMCVFYAADGLTVQGRMHARSSRGRNAKGSKITGFAYLPTGAMTPQLAKRLGLDGAGAEPGHRLLVSSNDSRLRMFDLQARQVDRKYKGHANASSQAYARLSSDGRYVISGSEDHNIYVWSVAQDNAATVATHPNSDHIRRVKGSNAAPPPASPTAPSNSSTKTQDNIFGSLFTRRKTTVGAAEGSSELPAQHAEGENPGEWESLDGRVEEKSIYEYFPAHDAAVSAALFAPASTLQYLAAHDDPILSRRKMRTTNGSGEVENLLAPQSNATFGSRDASIGPPTASEDNLVEDTTAIIVSADTSGNIRVFRKDINVQHTYMQDNASRASLLLKHRGSRSSLRDRISQHSRSVSSEIGGLAATATASRHHNHRTETALQSILAVSSESVQPRSATGLGEENKPAKTSFWSKLSRRKSLGSRRIPGLVHQSQTISGNVVASTVTPALLAGGSRARKTIRDGAHSDGEVEDSSVCEYCGHHGFVEFDVSTPKADTFSKPAAPKLAVCENCKRVKNMPV